MNKKRVFVGGFLILLMIATTGCSSKSKGGSVKSTEAQLSQSQSDQAATVGPQVTAADDVIEVISRVASSGDSVDLSSVSSADDSTGILVMKHDFGNNVQLSENGIYEIILTNHQAYQRVGTSVISLDDQDAHVLSDVDTQRVLGQSHCDLTSTNLTEETRYRLNWTESSLFPRGDTESNIPFVRVNYHGHRLLDQGEENSTAEDIDLSCEVRSSDYDSKDEILGQIFSNHVEVSESLGREILFQIEDVLDPASRSTEVTQMGKRRN